MPRLSALLLAGLLVLAVACDEPSVEPTADRPVADEPPSAPDPDPDPDPGNGATDADEPEPGVPDPDATEPGEDVAGDPATDERFAFTADTLDGSQVVGSELVGRDLALWFWAPW